MQLKRIITLLVVLLTSLQGFSQNSKVSLTGIVLTDGGQPAAGVAVALKGTTYSTLTDENGSYEISAEPGNYTLVVSFVGYKSKQTKINLQADQKAPNITIEEDMAALEEVQVAGKSKVDRVRQQAFNVTAVDIRKIHNTSADLNQVLNRTTGVRIRESGGMGSEFKFSLNGFSGNQVKFFLDGIPIDSYGSSFTLNNIPVNLAERIEVYKGVVPVELGSDALGGAVNIITNQSVKRYIDASYSFGSFNTHKFALNTRFSGKNGLIANINAFGNYSDNNFKINASIADKNGNFGPEQTYKQFHDGYQSGGIMAEVGVKNKKYADYLLFGMMVSANKKEVQTGTTMQRVIGDAFKDSQAFVPSLKFKKDSLFTKGLSVKLIASYSIVNNRSVDTSSYRYQWDGSRTLVVLNSGGEVTREKSLYVYDNKSLQTNTTFKYELNDNQNFVLNHAIVDFTRKEGEEFRIVLKPGSPTLTKNIVGLSYNLAAFDRKLSFSVFTKKYFLDTKMLVVRDDYATSKQFDVVKNSFNDLGYGGILGYFITDNLQAKTSYEHAFRLPEAEELLGDGLLILPAPGLKPESSDNFNAGFIFQKTFDKHSFGLEGNFIYRNAKNYIRIKPDGGGRSAYENMEDVKVTGFDGAFHYGYMNWLTFEINATHQKTIDNSLFAPAGTQIKNDDRGYQVQNEPILYGNANLGFIFRKIRTSDDNLSVNFLANYIDEYYLVSTRNGAPDSRRTIPEQFTQGIAAAYQFGNRKYNIGLECNNIADVKVYDYFKVQKQGRSFAIKFRYFIN